MQHRTQLSHGRSFPLGLRTDSSNMDPTKSWGAGVQMAALNLQTTSCRMDAHGTDVVGGLATQLHYALFELNGGHGYVLKPAEMRAPDGAWPPARQTVRRVTFTLISLHHLPTRGEQRPATKQGKHAACHAFTSLSGTSAPPKEAVRSPSIQLEVHPIGGFACVSEHVHPKAS